MIKNKELIKNFNNIVKLFILILEINNKLYYQSQVLKINKIVFKSKYYLINSELEKCNKFVCINIGNIYYENEVKNLKNFKIEELV